MRVSTSHVTALASCIALSASLLGCGAAGEEPIEDDFVIAEPQALTLDEHVALCQQDPRVQANVVSLDVCVGADIFFRETFDGNGRTCASCHAVENNFTIDPAFIATLPNNDPLFVAEFDANLSTLERPQQMRARSLILENVDGTDPSPNVKFTLRTTPHNWSMGVSVTRRGSDPSPPEDRTGWSGDGAPGQGRLEDFTRGATGQHFTRSLNRQAGVDFRVPSEQEGSLVAEYMRQLGRTNDIWLPGAFMSDSNAEAGRQAFLDGANRCNACHFNAGANRSDGTNGNFNTGVESARNAALAAFPHDGGFGQGPENEDGSFGDGNFNSTPLVEAADTGPFFHTDTTVSGASAHNASTANTIEQAVAFYDSPAFNNSPAGSRAPVDMTEQEINDIARFLRVLNAAFNAQLAVKRLDGAMELVNHFQNNHISVQQRLLELAREELDDALRVLGEVNNLNVASQQQMQTARGQINTAINTGSHVTRQFNISQARNNVWNAFTGLGWGMHFIIGNGTNMF